MNFSKNSFTVILFFMSGLCLAQLKPGAPNELDKKYTPDKTSVFNDNGNTGSGGSSSNSSSSEPDFVNVVKCNLTLIPRSIFALSYERFLTDQVSVEGSLGIAYNKDQIFGFLGSELDLNGGPHVSVIKLPTIYANGKKGGMGIYTGGSIKFHFTGGCYSNYYGGWGWGGDADTYLELGARYYTNSIQMSSTSASSNGSGSGITYYNNPLVSVRQLNYFINYGYRFTTSGKIKTSHELYMGAGLRNVSYDVFALRQVNSFPYSYDEYYLTGARENSSGFLFIMGYILGFGF